MEKSKNTRDFKVGDLVMRINEPFQDLEIGDVGFIIDANEQQYIRLDITNPKYSFMGKNFKLVTIGQLRFRF
jgi:hypothetical protein